MLEEVRKDEKRLVIGRVFMADTTHGTAMPIKPDPDYGTSPGLFSAVRTGSAMERTTPPSHGTANSFFVTSKAPVTTSVALVTTSVPSHGRKDEKGFHGMASFDESTPSKLKRTTPPSWSSEVPRSKGP